MIAKRRRSIRAALASAILSLLPTLLAAQQQTCTSAMSVNECFQAAMRAEVKKVDSTTKTGTASKATGDQPSTTAASTAIKDFLPTLASALTIPGLSTVPNAFGLEINIGRNNDLFAGPFTLQLEAVANQPLPSDTLVAALPKDQQSVVKDSLTRSFGYLDDLTYSFAFNLEDSRFGRAFSSHEVQISELMGRLLPGSKEKLSMAVLRIDSFAVRDPAKIGIGKCDGSKNLSDIPMTCLKSNADLQKAIEAASAAVAGVEAMAADSMTFYHLDRLEDLVNNQQQISVTGQRRVRKSTIGANQWIISARWEYSPVNLSNATSSCTDGLTAMCIKQYIDANQSRMMAAQRPWVSIDWSRSDAYSIALPSDLLHLTRGSSSAVETALGYGQYVGVTGQQLRLDGELRYRASNNQSVRQNRWTITGTITQKVSDQSNSVISVVWANRPEFVGNVDRHLTANIGISFKTAAATK